MYDGQTGVELKERTTAGTPGPVRGGGLSVLALVISVLSLVMAGAALFLVLREPGEPEAPPDVPSEEPREPGPGRL